MNAIETLNLYRHYGHVEAVHDLTFSVPAGSVTALLGPNGAGKTTTLRVLVNLLAPHRGSARVLGVDSRQLGPPELRQIGYVSEDQQQPDWMTVGQYLDYCRPFYPMWDRALEHTLLERFALPRDRRLRQLSRGMRVKAVMLSVLAYRPRVLLLDEPFGGLDPVVREEMAHGLIEAAQASEWTVLLASHDIEEVERLADRVILIDGGRLRMEEAVESLLGRFRRMEVELTDGTARLEEAPPEWLNLERAGQRVTFTATHYQAGDTEQACRALFPNAAVTTHPMTLREIYLVLAGAQPTVAKELVA